MNKLISTKNGVSVWINECLDYNQLANIFPRAVEVAYLAKDTEKCKVLGKFLEKEAESLEGHDCPKVQDLAETVEKMWICSSYSFLNKSTLH